MVICPALLGICGSAGCARYSDATERLRASRIASVRRAEQRCQQNYMLQSLWPELADHSAHCLTWQRTIPDHHHHGTEMKDEDDAHLLAKFGTQMLGV